MSRERKAALFAEYKEVFLLLLFRVNVPPKTLQFIGYYYSSFLYMTSKKKSYVNEKPCTHKSYTEDMII